VSCQLASQDPKHLGYEPLLVVPVPNVAESSTGLHPKHTFSDAGK
jgi:hypothetical protein